MFSIIAGTQCLISLKIRTVSAPDFGSGVAGSNPAGGEILPETKRRFIAQNLSCLPFHRLEMTEILLKGRKTLTHPSILEDTCIMKISLLGILTQTNMGQYGKIH